VWILEWMREIQRQIHSSIHTYMLSERYSTGALPTLMFLCEPLGCIVCKRKQRESHQESEHWYTWFYSLRGLFGISWKSDYSSSILFFAKLVKAMRVVDLCWGLMQKKFDRNAPFRSCIDIAGRL